MAETRWRKSKDVAVGGHLTQEERTGRVKSKLEERTWFRGSAAARPSRHSEDWRSRLKADRFHDEEEEDMWEVDDEDYIKVEDESEEEDEETEEEEPEEDYEEEDSEEEEDEEEEDSEEEEEESEEEFEEEEEEDVSEIAGIFKKRWGFDEDEEEEEDSEEVMRKAKAEEGKRRVEEEARRRKAELEHAKRDAELKKKALEQEARKKINEERKKRIEEERRKKKEEEELEQQKEEDKRKAVEEEKKRVEEVKERELEAEKKRKEEEKKALEEERRRKIYEERKRKVEEERQKKEEEQRLKEVEEEKKKQEELKREGDRRKEEEEKRRKINEERRKRLEEEKLRKEEEEKRKKEEEEQRLEEAKEKKKKKEEEERIQREKEEAKKKLDEEKRQREEEEAEEKRAEEERRREEERKKKEEARKEAERLKKEEEKRKQQEKKKREEEQRREEEERKKEAEQKRKEEESRKKDEERKKKEEEEKRQAEEDKKKKEEAKKKPKEEEKKKQERERLGEEEKKKGQAEKGKQKQVEESKAEKGKEEKVVKEKKKDKDAKPPSKEEEAKPTRSKTKSKRKADKIPTSEWSPDFPEFFAPTANDEVQNEECKKQSRIYVQHLRRMRTWALQMYDATAKLPSGILSGNVNQFGDFDECLAVDVHLRARGSTATADTSPAPEQPPEENGTSSGGLAGFLQRVLSWGAALVKAARGASGSEVVHIRGRYCLASVDVDVLPDPRRSKADTVALYDAVQRALSYRFLRGNINDTQHFVPRFSTVSWALCVPAACSAHDVQDGLVAAIRNWERGEHSWGSGKVRLQLAIPEDACRVASQQPAHKRLPPSFYAVIGGLAFLVMLSLIATLKDHGEADEDMAPERRMLIAFSLRRSWAVLSAPEDVGTADIHCMHGLRAVCSLALYMAHKVIPAASAPYSNRGKLTQAALSPMSLLLRSSVVYTDTFLLLSGALSSFHLSRELSRTGSLAWRDRYAARLFRLTPPLLALLLYYSFVMEHIGNGPRWGPLVEANARLCRKNMWRNLLYIQNFFPFKEMCAPQTHQLALDVQLSLLSAPLVWLLNYSPIFASPILLLLQAASAWLRHRTALQHRVALLIYHGQKPSELYRAADLSYALAPHRATAYLVGIALGYALHVIQRPLKLPKLVVIFGWIATAALSGWAIFGLRGAATKDFKFDAAQVATFNAFAPLAWALAISWVILACHHNFGGMIGRILSSRVLLLLSRISYAFYLTQFIVFFHNAGSARSQAEFSVLGVLDLWELVTVLAVSTIFTLLIDLPVQAVRAAFHHKAEPKPKNHHYVRRSKNWDGNNELTWSEKEE